METYTIITTKNDLTQSYARFDFIFEYVDQTETTEIWRVTTENSDLLEQLLDTDQSVLEYTCDEDLASSLPTTPSTLTVAEALKSALATEMAAVSHEAYCADAQGHWFAVDEDGDGVLETLHCADAARQFNPWHDNAVAIPIEDCFLGREDGYDLSWNCTPCRCDGACGGIGAGCEACEEDCECAELATAFCMDAMRTEVHNAD